MDCNPVVASAEFRSINAIVKLPLLTAKTQSTSYPGYYLRLLPAAEIPCCRLVT
jgi:hypothetical protein